MKICLFVYFCMLIPIMPLILVYRNYLRSYRCFSDHLAYPGKKPTPILLAMMSIGLSR